MATSSIRALILAVAVLVGGLLIANAFGGNPSQAIAPKASPAVSPTPTPSTSASATPSEPASDLIKGVKIQVLNATQTTGLGAEQASRLKHGGYKVKSVEQSATPYSRTTIYYKAGAKANAEAMKQKYYPNAMLKPSPASITAKVTLSVFLGADLVASSPSASSTSSP